MKKTTNKHYGYGKCLTEDEESKIAEDCSSLFRRAKIKREKKPEDYPEINPDNDDWFHMMWYLMARRVAIEEKQEEERK
jgi:hypothetical protein